MKTLRKKLTSSVSLGATVPASTDSLETYCSEPCTHVGDDVYCEPSSALLHVDAHEDGGRACNNQAELDAQRGVVADLVKQLARQILSGKLNLINISLPVRLFEPRSYLQKLTDVWVTTRFLHLAAQQSDPVERLKLVVTFFLSGIHLAFATWRKPFNPILGETWQASLPDSTSIHMEQISHHPPVSAFHMADAAGRWTFSGLSQPDVQAKLQSNVVRTTAKGYRCVAFANGGTVTIKYPAYLLHGIIYSSGIPRGDLVGSAEFVDTGHGLVAQVQFGHGADGCTATGAVDNLLQRTDAFSCEVRRLPGAGDRSGGDAVPRSLSSLSKKRLPAQVSSLLPSLSLGRGKAHPPTADGHGGSSHPSVGEVVARGCGNWLSHLDWQGNRYWTLCEEDYPTWQPIASPLPSDCRFRDDLAALQAGDVASAQQHKERLENLQRRDKKLRQEGGSAAVH